MTLDKLEVMRKLNEFDVPCGPILDMREIADGASAARNRHRRRSGSSEAW